MGGVDNVLKQSFVNAQKETSAGGSTVTSGELSGVIAGMRARGVSDKMIGDAINQLPGDMQAEYKKVFTPKGEAATPAGIGKQAAVGGAQGGVQTLKGKDDKATQIARQREQLQARLTELEQKKSFYQGEMDKWDDATKKQVAEYGPWDNPKSGRETDKAGLLKGELFYAGKKAEAREGRDAAASEQDQVRQQLKDLEALEGKKKKS